MRDSAQRLYSVAVLYGGRSGTSDWLSSSPPSPSLGYSSQIFRPSIILRPESSTYQLPPASGLVLHHSLVGRGFQQKPVSGVYLSLQHLPPSSVCPACKLSCFVFCVLPHDPFFPVQLTYSRLEITSQLVPIKLTGQTHFCSNTTQDPLSHISKNSLSHSLHALVYLQPRTWRTKRDKAVLNP